MSTGDMHDDRGASAVEFALILPILVLLVFGIVQFGLGYHRVQGLQAAAREGARVAAVGADNGEIRDRAREAQSLFADADVQVYTYWDSASGTTTPTLVTAGNASTIPCRQAGRGETVYVRTRVAPSATYAIVIPLWGNKQVEYTAEGAFRCEFTP